MIFTNAKLVTPDGVFVGTVEVSGSQIVKVEEGSSGLSGAEDLGGDYLLPGLIELHTDNLEKQIKPRPAVNWPVDAAMLTHDAHVIAAGITTVCDAVCVGMYGNKTERAGFLHGSVKAIRDGHASGVLKADHRLHLRCELTDPNVVELFEPLADEPELSIVSFMDHTPGQRQYRDVRRWKQFHSEANEDRLNALMAERMENQARYAETNRHRLVDILRHRPDSIALASHDDTTVEHVAQAAAEGMSISEFPTTEEAARAARAARLAIVMGAPNLVLGASQSGNIAARELAELDLLDALSSDYVPASLLHAAFLLADDGRPLNEAIDLVSGNAARLLGMDDRGALAPGLQADLVRVRRPQAGEPPAVLSVWREGQRVV